MEVVTPDTRAEINTVLDALRNDREKSRRMQPDGSYVREKGGRGTSSQEALYRYFSAYKVNAAPPPPITKAAEPGPSPVTEAAEPAPTPSPLTKAPEPVSPPAPVQAPAAPAQTPQHTPVVNAPIVAPPVAMEKTPPPAPVRLIKRIRKFLR